MFLLSVHGQWSDFGNWSECSASCGNGTVQRQRLCNNPTPENGGDDCKGEAVELDECHFAECPS